VTTRFSMLLMLACAGAWGAEFHPLDVKQGEWETTNTMQVTGLPSIPPDVLNQMPPEQRAKMEAMIAARSGKPTSRNSCMTKEKLQQAWNTGQEGLKACTTTVITSTSSKQDIRIECNRNGMKTNGNIKVEAIDSEHIRGAVQMTAADPSNSGQGMNMNYSFTSKWIGAACTEKQP
jgi:hypothetical protein